MPLMPTKSRGLTQKTFIKHHIDSDDSFDITIDQKLDENSTESMISETRPMNTSRDTNIMNGPVLKDIRCQNKVR